MIVGSLGLGACGTTTTQPPVEDRTGPATTAPIDRPAEPGTRALPDGGEPLPGALPGTAADADLLAKRRVHFAFDSDALDMDNRRIVEAHARYLVANPNLRITLEGHADERGTREYNLALGERRAQSVERVMRVLGVSNNRMRATSYGEEKPLAPESNESAWALNRRVEIIYR
jgi:peptidoglycan-associated lipoprotein